MTTSRRGYVRYPFAGLIIGLIACGGIFQGSNIGLVAQDLQYNCISCADKFDKCEIDCAWTLLDKNSTEVMDCQAGCTEQLEKCEDSDITQACASCMLSCAKSYDTDMRKCLGYFPRDTIATYNSELSSCPNDASAVMDDCMGVCAELYAHP